jgi:hypothetical protein
MRRILKFSAMAMALGIFLPLALFAGGLRQIETKTADGIEIWKAEFDVAGRSPGTYNVIVNAKDAAGNIGVGGPFNIKISPTAGLAEAHIAFPAQNMVIRSNTIDIVGTAEARYGLKQVILSMDGGAYVPIEGLEYWEYHIPSTEIPEGKHTVRVKAIDEFGVEGLESKMDFILDYLPPEIELINHQIGDIIAGGNVTVKGKVTERNGLQSLSISKDGGKTYTPLNHSSSNKKDDYARYFSFSIPSKRLNEGALVYYIRAINTTGVSVIRPVLFFVNNRPPVIDIMTPSETEDVYGLTQVTGRVISPIGLTQFYFEWPGGAMDLGKSKSRGELLEEAVVNGRTVYKIPLRPGDPFWAVDIFFSLANNRPVPFKITAIDKSGNKTEVTKRFSDKRKYRTPIHIIDYPPQPSGMGRMDLAWDQPIYGHINEGYFGDQLIVGNAVGQLSAKPSFRIPPEMIPVGVNTIQIYAMDEDEALGPKLTLRVNRAAPPPGAAIKRSPITIESPHKEEFLNFPLELEPVMELDQADDHPWVGDSVTVIGSIDDFRPGNLLEYRLKWNLPWTRVDVDNSGGFNVTIDLSKLAEGAVPMEFRTIRGGVPDFPLFLPVNKSTRDPVVTFMTPHSRFGPVERSTTASGIVDYFVPLEEISYSTDGGNEYKTVDFTRKYGRAWFNEFVDFTDMHAKGQELIVKVVDRAGNTIEVSPEYEYDSGATAARIVHNVPQEGDVITGDFEISGLAYTDVGVSTVCWRILSPENPWDPPEYTLARGGIIPFKKIETTQNYMINLTLADVRDGENILEIYAEDVYGVPGPMVTKMFGVSTGPPVTTVFEPSKDIWNKGSMVVRGNAFDKNGIDEVKVSMDNGISYQRADIIFDNQDRPSLWTISLNTGAYMDGQYSMLIRTTDGYKVQSFTNAIINIDNTPPVIDLGNPKNGAPVGRTLDISGQIYDNLKVKLISILLTDTNNPDSFMSVEPPVEDVILQSLDVRSYRDGDYTLTVTAEDMSGNQTVVIRNVRLIKAKAASEVAIINPLPGISHCGAAVISGRITGAVIPESVELMLDRVKIADVEVNKYGVFRYELPDTFIHEDGGVGVSAAFQTPSGEWVASYENLLTVRKYGPVLDIKSHKDGDVITGRPWLSGSAYMFRPPGERVTRQVKILYGVSKVELSFDNGRTFVLAKGTGDWKFRLETNQMEMGILPIIVRATFNNDEIAVRRILLIVDPLRPSVNVIGPVENSAYRTTIKVFGSTLDDYDMDSVEVSLRPGNKFGYSVPGFIQGLYLDTSFLGGLTWCAGIGLTFFEDNVKLQFNVSQAPSGRYSGWAFGGKVLANILNVNLGDVFGPDWSFWKTSIVLGAHFSYFVMEPGENPLWLGEFLGQWEVIKADMAFFFPKWKYFKSLSFYMEPGIWFAPSDVTYDPNAWRTRFTIALGLRINLF